MDSEPSVTMGPQRYGCPLPRRCSGKAPLRRAELGPADARARPAQPGIHRHQHLVAGGRRGSGSVGTRRRQLPFVTCPARSTRDRSRRRSGADGAALSDRNGASHARLCAQAATKWIDMALASVSRCEPIKPNRAASSHESDPPRAIRRCIGPPRGPLQPVRRAGCRVS